MTSTIIQPWWKTAPNPECASFCDKDHRPDEFTSGGGMVCRHVVDVAHGYRVEVIQWAGVIDDDSPAGEIDRDPATVCYAEERDAGIDCEAMTPEQARNFGYGLARALGEAANTAAEVNSRSLA